MQENKEYKYYNEKPTWSHNYTFGTILSMLDKNVNKKIIDLGCGNGSLAHELINRGFDVYGVDASVSGIEIAKKDFPERFFVCDLSSYELPKMLQNKNFDTVISTEIIEHLYNPHQYISFCKTLLNNNGEIILSTPYHGYLKNLIISILNKWDNHHTALWVGGHIKFWSKRTIESLLNEFDFYITDFRGAGRLPFIWKSMIIKARLS